MFENSLKKSWMLTNELHERQMSSDLIGLFVPDASGNVLNFTSHTEFWFYVFDCTIANRGANLERLFKFAIKTCRNSLYLHDFNNI